LKVPRHEGFEGMVDQVDMPPAEKKHVRIIFYTGFALAMLNHNPIQYVKFTEQGYHGQFNLN